MPQLVGSACSICGQRIGSVLDGAFCPVCKLPYHHQCRIQNKVSADSTTCRSCGATYQGQAAVQEMASSKTKQTQPGAFRGLFGVFRALRWAIGGICIIGIGILLLVDPNLRSDARRLTASDAAYGGVTILVGVVLLFLAYWSLRRRR
jgi:uncharacterized protein (TIGR03382 family)